MTRLIWPHQFCVDLAFQVYIVQHADNEKAKLKTLNYAIMVVCIYKNDDLSFVIGHGQSALDNEILSWINL